VSRVSRTARTARRTGPVSHGTNLAVRGGDVR
jgi:hypothetical protein